LTKSPIPRRNRPALAGAAATRRGAAADVLAHPYVLLSLAALFWSGNFVLGRAVHTAVPPIALAFWRWFGGFLIVSTFALPHLRRDWRQLRAHWPDVLILAVLGVAVFNTMIYIGLQSTTAINALLSQSVMPVMIVLFSFLLFGERVRRLQMLGIAISLSGVLVVIGRGSLGNLLDTAVHAGDIWVLGAVACYAAYSVLLRRRPMVHPISFIAATFFLGALLVAPFYAWESWAGQPLQWNRVSLAAIGYVAVFPSILAYFCFNRGVELVGANRAGLFIHLMPLFGSVLAIGFLGERFELFHAAGFALIISGIAVASRAGR
jgi:drug/metabolite transporter (DMT)-like permease